MWGEREVKINCVFVYFSLYKPLLGISMFLGHCLDFKLSYEKIFSHGLLAKQGDVGMVPHLVRFMRANSKNLRGCRDKNKTRLSLSSGLLYMYSGDVYSSTDDQYKLLTTLESNGEKSQTRHCQTTQKI